MDELLTERLAIREFDLEDAEFILQLLNEDAFQRYIGDKGVRTIEDARNYLDEGPMASYAENGFGLFHVAERHSGNAVGMCGLLQRIDHPHPDIGFAFLADFHAQGYAYESARAVLEFGYDSMKLETIIAFADQDNDRSVKLLRKLGFYYVGESSIDGVDNVTGLFRAAQSGSQHETS